MPFINQVSQISGELWAVLRSKTGQQTRQAFFGEAMSAALGFFANVFVIRKLNIEQYGLFSLFSSTMLLIAGLSPLGWVDTFVRFGSRHRCDPGFDSIVRYFFWRTLASVSGVSLLAFGLCPLIVNAVYGRPDFGVYFYWAVIAAFFIALNGYFAGLRRVRQDFTSYVFFQTAMTGIRFLAMIALMWIGLLKLGAILIIYVATPGFFLVSQLGYFFRSARSHRSSEKLPQDLRSEAGKYNRWLVISMITTNLIGNIDSHFLAHYFHENREVADFGVATRLTLPINFFITALTTILLPKLSAAKDPQSLLLYFQNLKKFLLPFAVTVLVVGLVSVPALKALAGQQYQNIDTIMQLQIVSLFIVLLVNPFGIVIYAQGRSALFAAMNITQLILDLALNFILIPRYGGVGATIATIGVNLLGLVWIYLAVFWGLRREERG